MLMYWGDWFNGCLKDFLVKYRNVDFYLINLYLYLKFKFMLLRIFDVKW